MTNMASRPSTNTGRFQYTGQVWLPELGMYHYKARIYSPTLGRFMQTDPIGFGGGHEHLRLCRQQSGELHRSVGLEEEDPDDCGGGGCPTVTGDRGFQAGAWIRSGGGGHGPYAVGGGGNPGRRPPPPPSQRERDACEQLRQNAEAGRDSAPFYAGANWDRLNDMIYFREALPTECRGTWGLWQWPADVGDWIRSRLGTRECCRRRFGGSNIMGK